MTQVANAGLGTIRYWGRIERRRPPLETAKKLVELDAGADIHPRHSGARGMRWFHVTVTLEWACVGLVVVAERLAVVVDVVASITGAGTIRAGVSTRGVGRHERVVGACWTLGTVFFFLVELVVAIRV